MTCYIEKSVHGENQVALYYVFGRIFFGKNTFIYLLHLCIHRKKTGKKYININSYLKEYSWMEIYNEKNFDFT